MIGDTFQHDFMIKICICDTFELAKHVFSGSGRMPLNTLQYTEYTLDMIANLIPVCHYIYDPVLATGSVRHYQSVIKITLYN